MKKVLINIILSMLTGAGLLVSIIAPGALWIVGFLLMLISVYALIGLNTDWLTKY